MHSGSGEDARETPKGGLKREQNAEQSSKAPAGTPAAAPGESKRPWAVRSAEGPSWAEKVEQF